MTWNKSWIVAATWSAMNWSTVLFTSGLNDCCWSFVFRMDTWASFSFMPILWHFSCCRLTSVKLCFEKLPILLFLKYFTYQLLKEEYLFVIFRTLSLVLLMNFWTFWWIYCMTRWLAVTKLWCIKFCAIYSGPCVKKLGQNDLNLTLDEEWLQADGLKQACTSEELFTL